MIMNKQYIVPQIEVMTFSGERLMDGMANISEKGDYGHAPIRQDKLF